MGRKFQGELTMPLTLYPYLQGQTWVFDDPRTGLKQEEAFVLGSSEMIQRLVAAKGIPHSSKGFELQFSDVPFDHDVELNWLRRDDVGVLGADGDEAEITGNWYGGDVMGQRMEGWLCPALPLFPGRPEDDIRQSTAIASRCRSDLASWPRGKRGTAIRFRGNGRVGLRSAYMLICRKRSFQRADGYAASSGSWK